MLGTTIKTRRKALHITGPELARRTGVTKGAISQIELGIIKKPSANLMFKICKVLGLDLNKLMSDNL